MDYSLSGKLIKEQLIESVITEEQIEPEEIEEIKETSTDEDKSLGETTVKSPGRTTALKIFFVRSTIEPESIKDALYQNSEGNNPLQSFLSKYNITVTSKEDGYFLLTISWLKYERNLYFLMKVKNGLWEIMTNEKMDHIRPSFIRMIGFCQEFGEMWLERSELEEVVSDIINPESIKGFISKRETIGSEKKVTIRVYGGSREDLDLARKHFKSEPTRVYFSRKNSPEAAVVGSVQADPGCFTVDRIIPSAVGLFEDIYDGIKDRFSESYQSRFVNTILESPIASQNEDGTYAFMHPKFRGLIISFHDAWDKPILDKTIDFLLLNGYKNKSSPYLGYRWGESNSFVIHDTCIGGMIQLRIEDDNKRLILNSLTPDKPRLLDDMAKTISEKIEHSIEIEVI